MMLRNSLTPKHIPHLRKGTNMKRSRIAAGLVTVAAVMLAGCSSSTGSTTVPGTSSSPATSPSTPAAPATPAAAHGVEATKADVPWSKVGPGWMLAMWSPVTPRMPGVPPAPDELTVHEPSTTLYLVDPQGNRYPITTFAPGADPQLIDWSGNG